MKYRSRNSSSPEAGFTLFELLIAMALTAIIGAVMFQTWNMTAQSGVDASRIVAEREKERIVLALLDNDMATMIFPGEENANLPPPATDSIELSDEFYEAMDRKRDDKKDKTSRTLLSFAGGTSLSGDSPSPGRAVCVEYVLRKSEREYALIRREREHCGLSGDFPWLETTLMDNISRASFEMVYADGKRLSAWKKEDLKPEPVAMRLTWTPSGEKEKEILFPVFPGSVDVEWEEESF